MSNESKLLEETEEKLFGMTYRIMKVTHWSCQKKAIIIRRKIRDTKIKK